jgi:hypothetical protein
VQPPLGAVPAKAARSGELDPKGTDVRLCGSVTGAISAMSAFAVLQCPLLIVP